MKFAVIGSGKTGSKVVELLGQQGVDYTIFNSQNQVTLEKLAGHNAAIVFVPGPIFETMIDLLVESEVPVVCAATGHTWPKSLHQTLQNKKIPWIYARNFAPGMTLTFQLLDVIEKFSKISDAIDYEMKEIHHSKKIDSPSGTAIAWAERIGQTKISIESVREGDEVGFHQLKVKLPFEEITLSHQSLDRKVFAHGAIEIAKQIDTMPAGLTNYEQYLVNKLNQ